MSENNYYGQAQAYQDYRAAQEAAHEAARMEQANYYGQQPPASSWTTGWLSFNDPGYLKGLVLGAAVTYVLTNPKVQRALVKGAVTLFSAVQGGFEEVKEQIQDIKSEMSMKSDDSNS